MSPTIQPDQSVASIVLQFPQCARVFRRHEIDYCCKGGLPVREVCTQRRLQLDPLLAELQLAASLPRSGSEPDFESMDTRDLLRHITVEHHEYLRKALPFIRGLALKVARVHGAHNPRLQELEAAVEELAETLSAHIDEEERVLFPALASAPVDPTAVDLEMAKMADEHLDVGDLLWDIRAATEDFKVPEWGCTSYRTLFTELEALEADTLQHVHLENNVLSARFRAHG